MNLYNYNPDVQKTLDPPLQYMCCTQLCVYIVAMYVLLCTYVHVLQYRRRMAGQMSLFLLPKIDSEVGHFWP